MFPQNRSANVQTSQRGQLPDSWKHAKTSQRFTRTARPRCRGTGERWERPTTVHPMRVRGAGSNSLAGTIGAEVAEIGMWKTENVANFYIRLNTCTLIQPSRTKRDHHYAPAGESSPAAVVESVFILGRAEVRRTYPST